MLSLGFYYTSQVESFHQLFFFGELLELTGKQVLQFVLEFEGNENVYNQTSALI